MYNSEDTKWFSQALFFHKDKTEGTDSSIRISTSTGTTDFASYTIPKLSIQIQNTLHKSINLDLDQARDLVIGIRDNLNREVPGDGEPVIRKITWNHELSISFHANMKTKISIRSSETDFSGIVISFDQFKTILKIMEQFIANYLSVADSLVFRAVAYQLNKLDDLNRNIRGLYGNMGTSNTSKECIQDNSAREQDPEIDANAVDAMTDLSDQLDNFLGEDMKNIKVPEIDEDKVAEQEEKTITEIKSSFFDMMKNDMGQVINMIHQAESFDSFTSQLHAMLDITIIPGMDEQTYNMVSYFTKLFIDLTVSSATQFDTPIPTGFPILKYKASDVEADSVNLAYDLLLSSVYLRMFRSLLENHQSDMFANFSVHHLKFRMFTDIIIFGILDGKSKEKILSAVMSRYDYYKKIGVFKSVDEKLKEGNYPEITKRNVNDYLAAVLKKAETSLYFENFYREASKKYDLKLPLDNNLNLEQIKNELIPLEIKVKLTKKLEKDDLSNLSNEVKELFGKKKKKSNQLNPIQMFVKKWRVEVPEESFEKLIEYLADFGDRRVDFSNFPLQVEDLEENVLKGLYYWDPEKYKNATAIANDLDDSMTKDLILAKILEEESDDKDGYGDAFANIEL